MHFVLQWKYFTGRFNTSHATENITAKAFMGEKGKKRQTQTFMVQDILIKVENKRIFCLNGFLA